MNSAFAVSSLYRMALHSGIYYCSGWLCHADLVALYSGFTGSQRPEYSIKSRNLEIADARYHKSSTILCSQFYVPGWLEQVLNKLTADAICGRFDHDSHKIIIEGDDSHAEKKKRLSVKEPFAHWALPRPEVLRFEFYKEEWCFPISKKE